jgi:hypothetical protein
MSKTDEFFKEQRLVDPDKWDEVADKYPVNSSYDEERFAIGEPPKRKRNRKGKSGGVPKNKKRQFSDDEWEEVRRARAKYYKEWEEDYRYAKELADEGF